MTEPELSTEVVIVGGGPAGMVLGLLLASQNIPTLVLERHKDFEREYRGEVLMPRFVQMMRQIGLFDFLEKYPHLKLNGFEFFVRRRHVTTIRVDQISREAPYILWMPQPVLLGALWDRAKNYPSFKILFNAHASSLIKNGETVTGIHATVNGENVAIRAKIVIGADGRASVIRHEGAFELAYEDHAFDVLWFTIPKPEGYENTVRAFMSEKHNYLVLPKYPAHLQCGILLGTGEYAWYRRKGVEILRKEIKEAHPIFGEFSEQLKDFGAFTLLVAKADRVKRWARPGLLLVGDAAHTCSLAGAIGVSVTVGTAIVAADVILGCFECNDFSQNALDRVQALREKEVEDIQKIQKRVAGIVAARSVLAKSAALALMFLFARTPVFKGLQQRLMVMKQPLPRTHAFHV